MTARYTEDALVEQPTIALMRELGWTHVHCMNEVFGAGGTLASYRWDIPCGPAIVMACLAIFLGTLIAGKLRRQRLAWQN